MARGLRGLAASVCVAACTAPAADGARPGEARPPAAPAAPEVAEPPADCTGVSGLDVTDVFAHTGAGFEAVVRLQYAEGAPLARNNLGACLRVQALDDRRLAVTKAARDLPRSLVLLLVDPGQTGDENRLARASVRELLGQLPPSASIAISRWGARVGQVASFVTDRAFLEERLEVGLGLASATKDTRAPPVEALQAARGALGQVSGGGAAVARAIAIVTPHASAAFEDDAVEAARPHLLAWIGPEGAGEEAGALAAGLRFPFAAGDGPAGAARALARRLDEYRRQGHYGIGYCGDGSARDTRLTIAGAGGEGVVLRFPAALAENRGPLCDLPPLARGERRFPRRVEFLLTDDERRRAEAIFARSDNRAIAEEDASEPWPLAVRLSPEHQPARARAHFRGASSFRCTRRNYTLELEGKAPRFMIPGSDANDVHLISMCLDRLYLRNFTALQLLADEGLMPVPFDLVELVINGTSQGVYLLTENVTASLRRRFPGVASVVRRRFWEGKTFGEVKWAADGREAALAMFDGILEGTETVSDADLMGIVRERLNVDQYLRWLAVMNTLASGDYVDEIYFYAVATLDERGELRYQQAVMGWDQDDILTDCHHGGALALRDEHGLVTCAESELDKRILANPNVYGRYVEALARTLERLTPERFGRALDVTAARLLEAFGRPETLAAMVELQEHNPAGRGPVSLPVARALIQTEGTALKDRFRRHHGDLAARLGVYRAGRDGAP